jgi:endonuclease YncB( thermonuclease family)
MSYSFPDFFANDNIITYSNINYKNPKGVREDVRALNWPNGQFSRYMKGDKMEIRVVLGHAKGNPDKRCSDGDSLYITGSAENVLVRLLGIDAFEVKGLSLYYLEESKFLERLPVPLQEHLEPLLTQKSIRTHKQLGNEASTFLEFIVKEEMILTFGDEVFDKYGRILAYVWNGDTSLNYTLIKDGYAIPYFIYPNAVTPTEKGEFQFDTLNTMREAALNARKGKQGIWPHIDSTVLPTELRYLTRREFPSKYCADIDLMMLHPPCSYFKVPIENRLFFYHRDVLAAVTQGFRPSPDCYEYLHKVWRAVQGKTSFGWELQEKKK